MSSRPKRRAAAKAIDYGKEQDFSDEDIFEDVPEERPQPSASAKKGRGRPRGSGGANRRSIDPSDGAWGGGAAAAGASGLPYGSLGAPQRQHYVEKGYDPTLPPIRERFTFEPEIDEDGSPKIELIIGRRPIEGKAPADAPEDKDENAEAASDDSDSGEDSDGGGKRGRSRSSSRKRKEKDKKGESAEDAKRIDYEYLVKYKGRSYLHTEWKTASDLESLNKSAKNIFRRWLKKLDSSRETGADDELEDPDFDPEFIRPERIVDEKEEEVDEELTDKELVAWEKEREKELAEQENSDSEEGDNDEPPAVGGPAAGDTTGEEKKDGEEAVANGDTPVADGEGKCYFASVVDRRPCGLDWHSIHICSISHSLIIALPARFALSPYFAVDEPTLPPGNLTIDQLRKFANRDGPYYPVIEGSDNPYRDGYVTEPPKKPRPSYLFFQSTYRGIYQKKNSGKSVKEIMKIVGDDWQALGEEGQAPFVQLGQEELAQYEKEKIKLEKAQKASEVWQWQRRCEKVIERLSDDSFSDIFQEPVDTDDFPDYLDVVDSPMDLETVRKKLKTRDWKTKYQSPENFARDMRKIWSNCKIYNQHGTAIWHVADYMSKQFERLYHAWVIEFRTRHIRWANPRARPWEHSCRKTGGKCKTPEDKLLVCDHCDASYGMSCLKITDPPDVWHCKDCAPKLKGEKGDRMLSALAEQAARKRAELGEIPTKSVVKTFFLVKWAGLGYEQCSWETAEDINDDEIIAEFRRLNNTTPEEPELLEEDVRKVVDSAKIHLVHEKAGGIHSMPDLRTQLYSQTRAVHFSKFGMDVPELLALQCGPKMKSSAVVERTPLEEAKAVMAGLVDSVVLGESRNQLALMESLPPCLTGEYDVVVPITSTGLMMNVGEVQGSVAFLGYRRFPNGVKGPSEVRRLVRNVGDRILAVDGVTTVNKSFKDVISLLKESGKKSFAYMRFLDSHCNGSGEFTSMGTKGQYAYAELSKKLKLERRRLITKRRQELEDVHAVADEESDESVGPIEESESESDSDSDGSEGSFSPDSDDELIAKAGREETEPLPTEAHSEEKKEDSDAKKDITTVAKEMVPSDPYIKCKQETTKSLAHRLLGIDIGYSSDEGGDEDCAHFIDGVDSTFTTRREAVGADYTTVTKDTKSSSEEGDEKEQVPLPVKRNEFSSLGDRSKLVAAMAVTNEEADPDDFDNYPLLSGKEIAAQKKMAEEEEARKAAEAAKEELEAAEQASEKSAKLSTTKVEQIDIKTNDVLRIWAKAEDASATLQLPIEHIRQLLNGEYNEEIGDQVGGYKWRFAAEDAIVTATGSGRGSKKGKKALAEFRDKLYDPAKPHIYKNGNRLRDYQVDGVNWLASCWYLRHSCILADEMGLGKTVQIVSYIEHIQRVEKIKGPFLVVVPLSTVEHWRREFEGWTDLRCCVYHDRQRIWRDVMREYEWYYADRPHTPDFLKFDVIVTTYDTLIGDFDIMGQIPWRVAVVDEAHRLRNTKGKLLECMKEISARGTLEYGFQSRVLMTGTPLQNNTQELWTLLNYIEPFKFPSLEGFEANYGDMNNRAQVEALQQLISPYMLRRVKEDVAKDIPAKEETLIDVELTSIQKQYYRAIFEHNLSFLNMGVTRNVAPKLMNIQMELRKCCNHPFLLDGIESRELENKHKELYESGAFEGKDPEEIQDILNTHGYVQSSGKMVLLDKLLPKLRKEGHKILIFSQMVKMLDLLSEYMDFSGFKHEMLTGKVRGNERQKAIDRFNTEKDSFAFLLSTRAGGVGINLTAADTCIIFDSDWNPQNDVQAQARCHRIGQTKDVRIYRLITSRTFEQEMFDRASKKLGLEQAVLGTFDRDEDDGKPSAKEMEELLKKGAYALVEDNDETEKFCADDIESILLKRTRTRVVEGAKTATWLNKSGLNVTKSKFGDSGKSAGIDVDDPLFWQKVMPDFVTPTIMMDKLKEMVAEFEGKPKGPGRGRGRKKKTSEEEQIPEEDGAKDPDEGEKTGDVTSNDVGETAEGADKAEGEDSEAKDGGVEDKADDDADDADEKKEEEPSDKGRAKKGKIEVTKGMKKKVITFMADLTSMMDDVFERLEDNDLPQHEKATCNTMLLMISVKASLFTKEQCNIAAALLQRLEGDRRRRCRTTGDDRFASQDAVEVEGGEEIVESLQIRSSKKKRKKRRKGDEGDDVVFDDGADRKRKKRSREIMGDDGFLQHSDDEGDWSDVDDNIYESSRNKTRISKKEAARRRTWASDKDATVAARRMWPSFPRLIVSKVLSTMMDAMIKYDSTKGGVFSEPVPRDEYPEYYEMVTNPMDYGTMKTKIESGEYRSAQAMQKDLTLVMQNCLKFNAVDSDIVKEAKKQMLMGPKLLRDAAVKHGLFIAEDGTVYEVFDEEEEKKKKAQDKADKRKARDDERIAAKAAKERFKEEKKAAAAAAAAAAASAAAEKKAAAAAAKAAAKAKPKAKPKAKATQKPKPPEKPPEKVRFVRCRECEGCIRPDCGKCNECSKMTKFGGKGDGKKACVLRKCLNFQESKKGRKFIYQPPKPRIRISAPRSARGKKRNADSLEEPSAEAEDDAANAEGGTADVYFDVELLSQERQALGEAMSFAEAMENLTKRGPFQLPSPVSGKFDTIAKQTIAKMGKHDMYDIFFEAVSEEEAPGYSDIVKHPMDFGTMKAKVDDKAYGVGSSAAEALYKDFVLVFQNCALFNGDEGEVIQEASRVLSLLPETFSSACVNAANNSSKKRRR